jgi:hypothetical protein
MLTASSLSILTNNQAKALKTPLDSRRCVTLFAARLKIKGQ